MRNAFSQSLVAAAQADPRIMLLTGDHGYALFDEFRQKCASQYLNAGVAEQNMVGVAAGLTKGGFRPIVYGLSAFVPMRVLEQIKIDVCYESLPIVFIGDGAGVVYGQLGASHQSAEDIAALRALPNIRILSPSDRHEMTACMQMALSADGPVYLRMGKADLGDVHSAPANIQWGQPSSIRSGDGSLAWLAAGSMVRTALAASAKLGNGPVWSMPSLKPMDADAIATICQQHLSVVVLEEHSIYGGLCSAVAEIAATRSPTWICPIGIQDRFSKCCGSYAYLMREHGLDEESVVRRVREFVGHLPSSTAQRPSIPSRRAA
jgi:transketolase